MDMDFPNSIAVLDKALEHHLYKKLLLQLNKDLKLAGISMDLPTDPEPEVLVSSLRELIYRLLMEEFPKYLNLLYVADVLEGELPKPEGSDAVEMADLTSFLLLKRIWKKVWLKNNLS